MSKNDISALFGSRGPFMISKQWTCPISEFLCDHLRFAVRVVDNSGVLIFTRGMLAIAGGVQHPLTPFFTRTLLSVCVVTSMLFAYPMFWYRILLCGKLLQLWPIGGRHTWLRIERLWVWSPVGRADYTAVHVRSSWQDGALRYVLHIPVRITEISLDFLFLQRYRRDCRAFPEYFSQNKEKFFSSAWTIFFVARGKVHWKTSLGRSGSCEAAQLAPGKLEW